MLGPVAEDLVGALVGHFRVQSVLGRGGMGVVYEARDEKLGRSVALKVLPAALARDRTRAARFMREARAAAAITHPAIATVYEIGESDGRLFIAMERISGNTLRDAIGAGALEPEQALTIAREVAGALAKAHAAGIVHRDLKPENVMLTEDGGVKILDFGIAKALDDEETSGDGRTNWTTRDGMILGTPGYMSPEQAAGRKCDQRADVFAFGVLVFEMLTGQSPFTGDTPIERLASVLKDVPAPLPDSAKLPPDVRELVERCLAKTPEERPADGTALRQILDQRAPSMRVVVRAVAADVDPLGHTLATPDQAADALASTLPDSVPIPAKTAAVMTDAPPSRPRKRSVARWILLGIGLVLFGRYVLKRETPRPPRHVATSRAAERRVAPPKPPPPAARELPPLWPCEAQVDAGFDRECSAGYSAWCDPQGERVGCCAPGLIPVGREGACGCPPGGVESSSPAAANCPVADAGPGLPTDVIRKEVRAHAEEIQDCVRDRKLDKTAGKASFALRIAPDGRVYSVRIKESSLASGAVQQCLLGVWRGMRFPAPVGSSGLTMVYPLEFTP